MFNKRKKHKYLPQKTRNKPKIRSLRSQFFFKIVIPILGLGASLAGIIAIMVIVTYQTLPSMDDLRNYQPKLPLEVFSSDGVLLGQFGTEHRIFISYKQTPNMLISAILAAEDERFFRHGGVDYIGIIRASLGNLISGHIQSGASTITMQVARNFFLSSTKSLSRKFNEVLLAYKIEKSLTKEQILELYINQIFLGQRSYGFAEAAITYFGKPINKLTIAEYAILASLPKAPSAFNPVVNKKRSRIRQLYVLKRMKQLSFIDEKEYNAAVDQKIVIAKGSAQDSTDFGGYVSEMVRQMLYEKYGEQIYTKGYNVYTTIDSKLQQAGYNALRNGLLDYDRNQGYNGPEKQIDLSKYMSDNNHIPDNMVIALFEGIPDFGDIQAAIVTSVTNKSITVKARNGNDIKIDSEDDFKFIKKYLTASGDKQIKPGSVIRIRQIDNKWHITQIPEVEGALVAINPRSGAIKTLIGGFDFYSNNFNHVTQAKRQPGSSFKPFIYSAALNKGITPDTIFTDSEACYPGGVAGSMWCPKNSDHKFLGSITLRQALTLSRNTVTVKIVDEISPRYVIDYVSRFGFSKSQFQPYLTIALGANEVTPLQMAQSFSVFANGGYLVEPYLIEKITDSNGRIIAKTQANEDITQSEPVIDPRNAFIMNSILQDVTRYGTGARAYKELQRNDIAGKTGTTNEARDVWFDGYTPNLVAITWVGFDKPKSLGEHQYGSNLALPIWIKFMQTALKNMPEVQLSMPQGITVKEGVTSRGNNEYYIDGDTEYQPKQTINESQSEHATLESIPTTESIPPYNLTESKVTNNQPQNTIENIIDEIQD